MTKGVFQKSVKKTCAICECGFTAFNSSAKICFDCRKRGLRLKAYLRDKENK